MTYRQDGEFLQRILDVVPGGIVEVTAAGAIRRANPQALDFLGMSFDAIEQRYVVDWEGETLNEDGSPCPAEDYPVSRCLMTGKVQGPTTIGVRRPNGATRWAVFTALPAPMEEGDERPGAVVTFIEITERKFSELRARAHGQLLDTARLVTYDDHPATTASMIHEPLGGFLALTDSRFGFIASVDPREPEAPEVTVLATID